MSRLNYLITALLLACLTTAASAQIGIGVRAGVTFSNFNFEGDERFDARRGFVLGIPLEIRLPGPLGLQIEANYSQFGSEQDLGGPGVSLFESDQLLNYLNLPVLLKVGLISDDFEASAVVGPSFGYVLDGEATSNGVTGDIEFDDDFRRGNVGLIFGAQGGVPVGAGKITLDVRYNLGLSNLDGSANSENKITNRQFQVALGYLFTIGG